MRGVKDIDQITEESWLSRSTRGHATFHFTDPEAVQLLSQDDATVSSRGDNQTDLGSATIGDLIRRYKGPEKAPATDQSYQFPSPANTHLAQKPCKAAFVFQPREESSQSDEEDEEESPLKFVSKAKASNRHNGKKEAVTQPVYYLYGLLMVLFLSFTVGVWATAPGFRTNFEETGVVANTRMTQEKETIASSISDSNSEQIQAIDQVSSDKDKGALVFEQVTLDTANAEETQTVEAQEPKDTVEVKELIPVAMEHGDDEEVTEIKTEGVEPKLEAAIVQAEEDNPPLSRMSRMEQVLTSGATDQTLFATESDTADAIGDA